MKKIALFTYSLSGGGTEKRIINLANYLSNKGLQTTIISFKNNNDYKEEYAEIFRRINTVYLSSYQSKIPRLLLPFIIFVVLAKVIVLVYRNKYALLIGFDYYSWYLVFLLSKLFNKKNIIVVGNNLSKEIEQYSFVVSKVHNILLQFILNKTNRIISVSKGVAYNLETSFSVLRHKIKVIYNGVDITKIKESLKSIEIEKDSNKTIIACGRLDKQKGYEYLIKAIYLVNKRIPNIKLLIIGKGILKEKLIKLMNDLNLKDKIVFLGFQTKPEMLIKKADIFVLSSLYEGFGNVIIEAMACGLPVVSTDCFYGPREIISDETLRYPVKNVKFCKYGILVKPASEKHLVEAILKLIFNNKLLMKYKRLSLQRANDFHLDKMGEKYYFIIQNLVKN